MSSEREAALAALLEKTGWASAERQQLAGDASTRRYERLILPNKSAILMDAPLKEDAPCPPRATPAERRAMGWNASSRLAASRVEAFASVAGYLKSIGLSTPEIYGADTTHGFAVLEDLGDRLFANVIPPESATELFGAAAEVLAHVHMQTPPPVMEGSGARWPLLDYDALALEVNADLFVEWLPRGGDVTIDDAQRARWERVRDSLIVKALGFPRAFTIRDFHAENLLWLPERDGLARVGLLDFQDAVRGWRAWDFVMLLHDGGRRDVPFEARHAAINRYLELTGASEQEFMREFAVLGALNAMRILGLFTRLAVRDNKTRYLAFMPRLWSQLAECLAHPALSEAQAFVSEVASQYLEGNSAPVVHASTKVGVRPKTAMVLAAGKGTRMAPLTDDRPKPLVELAGRTLIDHMLDRLLEAGVERAVVNVHYRADQLEAHLKARREPQIVISDERAELLETGGGVRKARPLLGDEPVFHVNTDSVWIGEGALAKLAAQFDPSRMDALLLLVPMNRCIGLDSGGDFKLAVDGRITHRFDDASADLAWMGVQIIDPRIMDVEPIEAFSFRRVWKRLWEEGRLYGTVFDGFWLHVGDPGARDAAEARLAEEAAPAKARA